jgi:DNA-binding GntR family transcriptional regulator
MTSAADRPRNRIRRISLTESIAQELSTQILNGEIAPGANLREVELSQDLGVSRQSLRAAMAQLSSRGLLQHEMNRGFWVPVLTREDAKDIFELRELIEGEAARRLASNLDRIDPVLDALRKMERLDPDVGWGEYLEVHFDLHRAIVAATGSPRLLRHFEMLSAEAWVSLLPSRQSERYGSPHAQLAGHQALVDAIRSGDEQRAVGAVRAHLWGGFDDLYPAD